MTLRLAQRLTEARRRRFVGRAEELATFHAALSAPELPFTLLYVFGPSGIGKTSLLRQFAWSCLAQGIPAYYIDARTVEPSPRAFQAALGAAIGLDPGADPCNALAAARRRHVILLDTYEAISALDSWLREAFLPALPADTLVVLASRHPLGLPWCSDPGWQTLIRTLALRNLRPQESRAYLTQCGVPATQHDAVLAFTHGHPLALSLVADVFAQRPQIQFQPELTPDIVKTLMEQFVQKVPGPAHRAALEACALVRHTNQALLSELLGFPEVHDLFQWLRELSFIESVPLGLFPHDLARETLVTDLRWRNPPWYAELHHRARRYYSARLQQVSSQQVGSEEQQAVLIDYIYLHRDNPVVRPFFVQLQSQQETSSAVMADAAAPADHPAIVEIVRAHEGEDSARIAAQWLNRQPDNVLVFRDGPGRVAGMLVQVALTRTDEDERRSDPGAVAAWEYLHQCSPLRPGEQAILFRFWMARDTYQAISLTQSLIFVQMVRHYLTTPGLAFTFLPCAAPEFWAPIFAYADLARLPEADFVVGNRRYGVYGHDWRAVPPMAWLALLAERELSSGTPVAAPPQTVEPLLVLSQPEFAAAVRSALHDYARPDALRTNPLLRSRLVVGRTGAHAAVGERAAALQELLRETVERLQATPRLAKCYRALYHTYLHPAATQEQAAELLDLPFSTFRRHLRAGIAFLIDRLWEAELQGSSV